MIHLTIDAAKSQFFDRPTVKKSFGEVATRALSRFGAFVRQTAKRSIRSAPRHDAYSKPGHPPLSHTGLLRENIFFSAVEGGGVIIGPALLHGRGGAELLELLEMGGTITKRDGTQARYEARPFMGPALEAERPKFPQLFIDGMGARMA